jgi:thiamine biosynthesis lipoprotein
MDSFQIVPASADAPQKICRFAGLAVLLLCLSMACTASKKEHLIAGKTMGTTFHVKVAAAAGADLSGLQRRIEERLEQLNQSMSTYRRDSEISTFNRFRAVGEPFPVSEDFYKVMAAGAQMFRLTQGAWDGTVSPLVQLWGFGSARGIEKVPDPRSIDRSLAEVGFEQIDLSVSGSLIKRKAGVSVDLGSIAKGYGVDAVAQLIRSMGFRDYLVEIGGEVYAAGRRADGKPWKVGINRPDPSAPIDAVHRALSLQGQAMATSGDYRNFIVIDGQAYSHIIDPRSGYPVDNGVVSASVIAPTCTLADGLATALMVLGPEQGVALLDRLNQVEGLMIVRRPDGKLHHYWSAGMDPQ